MRISTAIAVSGIAVGVALVGAAPAMADDNPGPGNTVTIPGQGFGHGPGFDRFPFNNGFGGGFNHGFPFLHPFHHGNCFFVHRHVRIRFVVINDQLRIVRIVNPAHIVCLSPFYGN